MANHASAIKRIRQNKKKNLQNRMIRSRYKTEVKGFLEFVFDEKNKGSKELQKQLSFIHKIIDKARTKGIISKNAASRKKSQMASCLEKKTEEKTKKKV